MDLLLGLWIINIFLSIVQPKFPRTKQGRKTERKMNSPGIKRKWVFGTMFDHWEEILTISVANVLVKTPWEEGKYFQGVLLRWSVKSICRIIVTEINTAYIKTDIA